MAVLGVMIAAAAILSPTFRNAYNIRNIAAQAAVLSVVAIAQCKVLFIGGIDMSVSSVISFSTILVALFSRDTMHAALFSILLALAAGALTGLINGIGIVTFQIPAMIITISTQAFLKGICLILMPGSGGKVNAEFAAFLKTRIGILNISILLAIAMYILAFFILHYTRFGRNIYAIGNGEVYAEQSGIKVKKNILIVYMISGMIAAFAGVLLSARISTGNPLVGDSYAMDSVAAAAYP